MLKPIKETEILKRYSNPSGEPPDDNNQSLTGSISIFPSSPLDMPSETFENALKRREKNHRRLIQWIKKNLHPDVDYGRIHVVEQCRYAKAGVPHQCSDFSHMSMLTLWKAGAEKVLAVLGLSVHFPNLHQYELSAVHKQEITQVILKCQLKNLNGKMVGEGAGARYLKQDDWNTNKAIKMCMKSAVIDATIRVAGLTGVFIKTHRHTVKNNLSRGGSHHLYVLPPRGFHTNKQTKEKPITDKQKHLIKTLSGRKGMTIESLNQVIQDRSNKPLDDLNRVEASNLIQHLNGFKNLMAHII